MWLGRAAASAWRIPGGSKQAQVLVLALVRVRNRDRVGAPGPARAANRPKKTKRKPGQGRTTSTGRLRRLLRSSTRARAGRSSGPHTRSTGAHATHFLHAFPLFRPNYHNKLGHKDVALHGAACDQVI